MKVSQIDPLLGRLVLFVDARGVVHPAIIKSSFSADPAFAAWLEKNQGGTQEQYDAATKDTYKAPPVEGAPPAKRKLYANLTVFLEANQSYRLSVPYGALPAEDVELTPYSFVDAAPAASGGVFKT